MCQLPDRDPRSHSELYMARGRTPQGEEQNRLGALEHEAFAREYTNENPILGPISVGLAIPAYSAAKGLGIIKARTPGSLTEVAAAYRGIADGVRENNRDTVYTAGGHAIKLKDGKLKIPTVAIGTRN